MRRRPPGSTRTDTLFPYTTLFRSLRIGVWHVNAVLGHAPLDELVEPRELVRLDLVGPAVLVAGRRAARLDLPAAQHGGLDPAPQLAEKYSCRSLGSLQIGRASCRKECVSTCRSRWSPYH